MWPGRHGRWNGSTLVPGYVYDNAGNLTAVKDVYGSTTLASYNYTDAGLLNQAQYGYDPATQTWRTLTNTWDADSNRIGMNANGTAYAFVYDTTAGIPAVIEEHTETNTVYYIREPGGELIARVHPTEGIRYYHFDELGSTRLLTNSNGDITDRYAYDAYGSLLSRDRYTGSVDQPYQYVGQLGYYTHWMEPEFTLLQLGVRFYDAEAGRFTSRDPLGDEDALSEYNYVSDSPFVAVDPTGLAKVGQTDCDPWSGNVSMWRDPNTPCCLSAIVEAHEMVHQRDMWSCCSKYAKCYKKFAKQRKQCDRAWNAWKGANLAWLEYRAYSDSLKRAQDDYAKRCFACPSHRKVEDCRKLILGTIQSIQEKLKQYKNGKPRSCGDFFGPGGNPKAPK